MERVGAAGSMHSAPALLLVCPSARVSLAAWHATERPPRLPQIYGWPFGLTPRFRRRVDPWKEQARLAVAGAAAKLDCRRCLRRRQHHAPEPELPMAAQPSLERGRSKEL